MCCHVVAQSWSPMEATAQTCDDEQSFLVGQKLASDGDELPNLTTNLVAVA